MYKSNRHPDICRLNRPAAAGVLSIKERPGSPLRARKILLPTFLCLLVMGIGCSRARVQYEEIYRDDKMHIRLAERQDKSGETEPRSYDHPWNVHAEVLDDMLESVLYKKGKVVLGGGKSKEAFPAFQRRALLKHIQGAFARAGVDQAVDFSFVHTQSSLKVFRRTFLTDGIMFRKEGRLNIAFRNLAFEEDGGAEESDYEPNRADPTESPMRTSWTLVAGDGQSLVERAGSGVLGSSTYTNWIRLDLSWPWGIEDEAIIKRTMPDLSDDLDSAVGAGFTLPDPETPTRAEVEERLQFLEELRRDGMIAERTYVEKKRELDRLLESLPQ